MSVILAVESGGENFSAALHINGESRQVMVDSTPHSQKAFPIVQSLLAEAGITLAKCDAFAFGAGPGRFSGLRLACGIAQAFAFAVERPGVAVNSLAALAEANYGDSQNTAFAALPAHRGHAYVGRCRRGEWWVCPRPKLATTDTPPTRARHCCGRGFISAPALLPPRAILGDIAEADAEATVKIAVAMYHAGEVLTAPLCRPLYVRRQVAQTAAERRKNSEAFH